MTKSPADGRRVRARGGGGECDVAAFEDAYQMLRARLAGSLSDIKQPRLMITSPSGHEGKTMTCVNLAVSFAKTGQRVVVVDLDLRHPDAHRRIGAHNDVGLTDLLLEGRPPEECLQFLELPGGVAASGGIYFLATGPVVQRNPAELLSMSATSRSLDQIAEQADVMLIDTPPVLAVADALIVGHMVAGALLVVEARRSSLPELNRAKEVLIANQTPLLGVVLNKFDRRDRGYWNIAATTPDANDTSV